MDARLHERPGEILHGLVKPIGKLPLFAVVAVSLVCGVAGGLVRAGVLVAQHEWLGQAAVSHAALMICGFFGTVIGIERATAAKRRIAWLAPVASAFASLALIAGLHALAAALLVIASASFMVVNAMLWWKEPAPHTFLLACAAASWVVGNLLFALGVPALEWWFGFLVVTIAAERLEMARLLPRRPVANAILAVVMIALAAGAALSPFVFGIALTSLALWLLGFDIARRTIRSAGLPRYMAVCLLSGYGWLAIGGVAWSLGIRDAALHALGLGFVVSMVMAHAPVILPAVARVKLHFNRGFYAPLVLLHTSLAWRLLQSRGQGAAMNAVAIALFALTVFYAALQKRKEKRKSRPDAA
jgi:hypothetical protein